MSEDIPEWEFWEWTSILDAFLLVVFAVVLIWAIVKAPETMMRHKIQDYNGTAKAFVTNIKKCNTKVGIGISGLIIYYNYTVNGMIYSGQEIIPNLTNSENQLIYRLSSEVDDTISVKYLSKDPTKSLIIIGED